jgi:phosphoglycerate dehydrogenase-like enzyme
MKLAILDDYQRVALQSADWGRLGRRGVEVTVFHEPFASVEAAAAKLAPFQILCLMRERTAFPRALVERLPSLKFVSLTGLRAGTMDSKALGERGIPVSNTRPGSSTGLTAELAWGLIIMAARGLAQGERNMRSGRWHEGLPNGIALEGKRLGLMGLGKIGQRVGAIGKAFGMQVQAWSQNLTPERAAEGGGAYVSKEALVATSDVLSLHLVLSERTRGIVGRTELESMKEGAILVNVSRGPLVDETALLDGLRKGRPAHAALDVYDREPLPADHPLRRLKNVTLSPHLGYVNDENLRIFHQDSVENVEAWLDGKPIRVMNAEFLKVPLAK